MFDAYSVAVKLRLVNAVTPGLMTISQQFAKTHRDALALQRQLDKIRLTMKLAGGVAATGFAGLGLIGKTAKVAGEYTHQLAQMRAAGMSNLEIAQATAQAWKTSGEVMTSSAADNLAAIRELRMVFGNTRHAMENVSTIQKIQAILSSTGHGGNGDEAYTVAKALELRGAVRTPAELAKQADLMTKAIIASGGKVAPQDFLSAFTYGRAATIGWSDQFTYGVLPTLIQEQKGAGGGGQGGAANALMSAYAAIVQGKIPQKALGEWEKLKLLDPRKIVWNKVGSAKGVLPGGIKGTDLFVSNPLDWSQNVLLPALKAAGYDTEEKQRKMIPFLFQNRTASFSVQQMVTQAWKFQRDQALIDKAIGLKDYDRLAKEDPVLVYQELQKKWQETQLQIGLQVLPMLIDGTEKLTYFLRDLNTAMRNNPEITKSLTLAFTALSGAIAFGGSVWLLRGAFLGVKLALGAVGGAGLIGTLGTATTALGKFVKPIAVIAALLGAKDLMDNDIAKRLHDHPELKKRMKPFAHSWGPTDWLFDRLFGKPKWKQDVEDGEHQSSPYVRPAQKQGGAQKVSLVVDGRKLGEVVLARMSGAMSGPQTGYSGFDGRMQPIPVGAVSI